MQLLHSSNTTSGILVNANILVIVGDVDDFVVICFCDFFDVERFLHSLGFSCGVMCCGIICYDHVLKREDSHVLRWALDFEVEHQN